MVLSDAASRFCFDRLTCILSLNFAAYAAAFGVGYCIADPSSFPPLYARHPDVFWPDVLRIATNNIGAAVVLLLGIVCTAGISGIFIFGLNGYIFGVVLGSLPPDDSTAWVLAYAPLEIVSFLAVAAVGYKIIFPIADWIKTSQWSVKRLPLIGIFGAAVIGIVVSAFLESYAIQRASNVTP